MRFQHSTIEVSGKKRENRIAEAYKSKQTLTKGSKNMDIRVGSRQGGRGNGFRGGSPFKKRQYLTGDFARDMLSLRIKGRIRSPQTRKETMVDETPQFITYLTLALQNISDIIGEDISKMRSKNSVEKSLKKSGKLWEVASFLWLHAEDQPKRDFAKLSKEANEKGEDPDYVAFAKAIVVKLWELRNMFVHWSQHRSAGALVVDKAFYRFVEGELYSAAMPDAIGLGRKSEKMFKLRLFNPHDDAKLQYEFTRKGMIFLVSLALYRHDASEFIQQFPDLQLPPREWEMEKGYKKRIAEEDLVSLRKKGGSIKAILDAFTHYSMRASRTDIDLKNKDYLNFANVLTYLNKVPMASYNYLTLREEAQALAEAAEKSTESEENKRFKYLLHPRQKDRFLTLALAFIEDFHVLDCIRFKRLDITVRPERSRYMFGPIEAGTKNEFGDELSDANGMDRHYVISHGNAEFEYVPEKSDHENRSIRISRLRGRIGEGEIMRLLLAFFTTRDANVPAEKNPANTELQTYLRSYHRILERMLNAKTLDELKFDSPDFKNDFKRVSGKSVDALTKENFVEEMKPFFPAGITRYFVGDEMKLDTRALQDILASKLAARADRASDFLKRLDRLTDWRELDEESRKRVGPPICKIGELKYPPRTCKMTDAQLIKRVLDYINLNLNDPNDKFRQLPRGLRHRGIRDVEFQMLHRDIGRFGSNPDGLWRTLKKREALNGEDGPLEALKARERELFQAEQRRCRGKVDKNGRPLRVGHTLTMLSAAATELYRDTCTEIHETWCRDLADEEAELLPFFCRMYGVRTGMPLDRDSLVKTILGIDLQSWSMAYDYENGAPRTEPRKLEDAKGLIVSQIPVPNLIAIRCMPRPDDGSKFQFNPVFRAFLPYEEGRMALRKYYDVAPLIAYVGSHTDRFNEAVDPSAPGVETRGGQEAEVEFGKLPPKERAGFSRNDVNRAIQEILRVERQDKLLLACAKCYWDRYMDASVQSTMKDKLAGFSFSEFASIGEFFSKHIDDRVSEGVTIRMMPNDFARPVYSVITEHLDELVPLTKPIDGEKGVYSLYDLNLTLKDLQRKENSLRLNFLPAVVNFEILGHEPEEKIGIDALFEHYKKELLAVSKGPLTREEFDAVVAFRNRLVHPRKKDVLEKNEPRPAKKEPLTLSEVGLDFVAGVLRRFGCLRIA